MLLKFDHNGRVTRQPAAICPTLNVTELYFNFTRQVQKVHIGHDSKGRNKGVFVEEIEVTAPDAPKVIFPCRCWLAENEDDGKTTRVIVPGESLTQPYDSK